jgi:hypothetical protein
MGVLTLALDGSDSDFPGFRTPFEKLGLKLGMLFFLGLKFESFIILLSSSIALKTLSLPVSRVAGSVDLLSVGVRAVGPTWYFPPAVKTLLLLPEDLF